MTSEDIRSELEREPFRAFRLHMVSGKTLDVLNPASATLLQNAMLILKRPATTGDDAGYDMIAFRNVERIEQLVG